MNYPRSHSESLSLRQVKRASATRRWRLPSAIHYPALFIILALVAWILYGQTDKPVTFLLSGSPFRSESSAIGKALLPYRDSSISTLDLIQLKRALSEIIGVGSVELRREWPNKIYIKLGADQPIASLNEDSLITQYSRVYLISEWRRVFESPDASFHSKPDIDRQLARLPHFEIAENLYREKSSRVIDWHRYLNRRLNRIGMQVAEMKISQTGAIGVKTTNRVRIDFCRGDVENKLDRLAYVWRRYLSKIDDAIQSINLCYPNGLAWRAG